MEKIITLKKSSVFGNIKFFPACETSINIAKTLGSKTGAGTWFSQEILKSLKEDGYKILIQGEYEKI